MDRKAQKSLERLRPRIEPRLVGVDPQAREIFWQRVEKIFPEAFALLLELYGTHYAFFYYLEEILKTVAQAYCDRSPDLHILDRRREGDCCVFRSGGSRGVREGKPDSNRHRPWYAGCGRVFPRQRGAAARRHVQLAHAADRLDGIRGGEG